MVATAARAAAAATANGTNRWTRGAARTMHTIPARDDAFDRLARLRIDPEGFVFHALLDLEATSRLRRIGRFVNIDWHKDYSAACRFGASFGSAGFSVG